MNWFSNSGDFAKLREECSSPPGFPASESDVFFCSWNEDGYEGGFYMLFKRDGRVYEQQLSHCSCNYYGEDAGTWAMLPPVTPAYLAKRQQPYVHHEDEKTRAVLQVAWDAALEMCA